jgi:hypothetical protein
MSNIDQIIDLIPVSDQSKWLRLILDIKPLKSYVTDVILLDLEGFDRRFKSQYEYGIQNKTDYLIDEFIRSDHFKKHRYKHDLDFLITKLEINLQ